MADLGIVETDKRMRDLSKRLTDVYGEAYNEAVKNTESALKKLQDFRREMNTQKYANLDDEQKSNKLRYYATQHIRAEGVAENIADQLKHAGELSQNIIRGELGNMYALNYDFGNYSTIRQTGLDISFTQYDKNQIAVLVAEGESPFTKVAYKSLKLETTSDEAIRKLQNQLIIATVNGESQAQLIKRIHKTTGASLKRAKRIAQTERTRVQTQARMQSIHEAERLGIEMNKQWVARLVRTRESHQHVHEEIVGANEAFSNGLRYPGEIGAPPAEVVNCFCYIKPMVKNVGPAMQAHRADMQAMSFDNYRERLKSSQNIGLQNAGNSDIISYKVLTKPEIDELQKQSDDVYKNKLTIDERTGLNYYTADDYKPLNDYLYGFGEGSTIIKDRIAQIDSAIDKFSLKEDIIVYRGTDNRYYSDWETGDVKTIDAYISSAVTKEEAEAYYKRVDLEPVMLEISVRKGTKSFYVGENNPEYGSEDELLLGRGLKYKVIERVGKTLKLEVIP